MGDYLPRDNLSPRKKCQEKLKPGNKSTAEAGHPLQLPDAGTLLAEQIDDLALMRTTKLLKLGGAGGLGIHGQKLLHLLFGQAMTGGQGPGTCPNFKRGDRGQVPVPILKISVLHTYSLVLF